MSFALAVAVVAVLSLVVVGVRAATLRAVVEDEPPSTVSPSTPRQVAAVIVAALLRDEDSLLVAFAPPAAEALTRLPGREWGTVVVERPCRETVRTLEAWRQSGERLVLVAETPSHEDGRQVTVQPPRGPILVLSA